jgi:cell wall-associated NlpC family hydrolase
MDMMQPYFRTDARRLQFRETAQQWPGTPLRHRNGVRGHLGGCDCVTLQARMYATCGAIPHVDIAQLPAYPMDWHLHNKEQLLEKQLEAMGLMGEKITDKRELQVADLLCFCPAENGVIFHLGSMVDEENFIHAIAPVGVIITSLRATRFDRLFAYGLRPMERCEAEVCR